MQLLEIEEPNAKPKKHELAIGIDFGTTNSLAAFSKGHKPYVIEMIPSIVGTDKTGRLNVMEEGLRSVKRQLVSLNPDDDLSLRASAAILAHLKARAEKHLGQEVHKAVITVPAYFDDSARGGVAFAAKLAGLEVLRLISEPTAAAYAYGLENESEGVYLIYDLGGGTFDVSVLNMQMGVFQVLAVGGDSQLGGDDIDALIAQRFGISALEAKKWKEERSANDDNELDAIISPVINRTMEITAQVIAEVDRPIDGIILVGGSTRFPLIKKELTRRFGLPVFDNLDPDAVVALGAALQAENLTGGMSDLLIDVVPLSLGMELMGGLHEKIIERNTPIPTSVTKEFTTYSNNQTAMNFHIVQGERELVQDCRSLARFELALTPAKAGSHRVEITFAIDADGLVSISARDKDTGNVYNLELKPTYGLKDEDMIGMLKDAFANAESDYEARKRREATVEAERVIEKIKSIIKP